MLENFQPIKIVRRIYWLNTFLTKSKSILTESDNIINLLDAETICAGMINLVFFSIFGKSVY